MYGTISLTYPVLADAADTLSVSAFWGNLLIARG
jgi:hypothetical protein